MFGKNGRIGIVLPANNATLEPEFWPVIPEDVAVYVTRILAKGDLTPEAVKAMEVFFDQGVDELCATGVDLIVYADMVTTFIMDEDWNERRTKEVTDKTGVSCISAWTSLVSALSAKQIKRFALATPYPAPVHALVVPFLEKLGYEVIADDTLDIVEMTAVPEVRGETLSKFIAGIPTDGAEAIVILATDLPTFSEVAAIERSTGLPVLTSNQAILWEALRKLGRVPPIPQLGQLFQG